jgi:hypothetical protein
MRQFLIYWYQKWGIVSCTEAYVFKYKFYGFNLFKRFRNGKEKDDLL